MVYKRLYMFVGVCVCMCLTNERDRLTLEGKKNGKRGEKLNRVLIIQF